MNNKLEVVTRHPNPYRAKVQTDQASENNVGDVSQLKLQAEVSTANELAPDEKR